MQKTRPWAILAAGAAIQVLTGLPADCPLTAGQIVTTLGGDWLGMLAAAPVPDADGLTASAQLIDTADLHAAVYFVRTD